MIQERGNVNLVARSVALVAVFASFYTIFTFLPLFPVIGGSGSFITMAVVTAPLMGIVLGPYLSTLSVAIGGIIGLSLGQIGGPFGPLSFVPHAATAFCSGMLIEGKQMICTVAYTMLLVIFALFPVVGPAWLYPSFVWMHIVGLVILVSPVQSKAVMQIQNSPKLMGLTFGVCSVSLTSTLFGHIVGNILFEIIYWPTLISSVDGWKSTWQFLSWIYPLERALIVIATVLIGTLLIKAIKASRLKL